jgi:putative glutamine amidotransferase
MSLPHHSGRPIVGVPTQTLQSLGGVSAEIPPSWVMSQRYILTLVAAGAVPVMIPLVDDGTVHGIYDELDAVFLPGGADIDPATYGKGPHPLCDKTDRERDRVELELAKWAMEEGKPVLGVCRGMQLINVAFGGTLVQHLPGTDSAAGHRERVRFAEVIHDVDVLDGSRLRDVLGASHLGVNTLHHQAVDQIGSGLVPVAWSSDDGIVEAIESVGTSRILGVQWHPELLGHLPGSGELFAWLVSACTTETALVDPSVATVAQAPVSTEPPARPKRRRSRSAV